MKLKKFLFILFLFILFIFLFNIDCFAYTESDLGRDVTYDVLLGYCEERGYLSSEDVCLPYLIYNVNTDGYYYILLSDNSPLFKWDSRKAYYFKGTVRYFAFSYRWGSVTILKNYDLYYDDYTANSNLTMNCFSSSYIFCSFNFDCIYEDGISLCCSVEDSHTFVSPFEPSMPEIPFEELFKIHLKDINCGVWRNFTLQYPGYSDEKYILYLDSFRRDYSNCTEEVEAVFKLIVFNDENCFLGYNDFLNNSNYIYQYQSLNSLQKYCCHFTDSEGGYYFLSDKDTGKIYVPFNCLSYNVFESTVSFPLGSSNYNVGVFNYVDNVGQNYFDRDYDSINGDFVCVNKKFVGSNCNIISVVDNEEIGIIANFVSRLIFDFLLRGDIEGATYRYYYAYDCNAIYSKNSACYGSNSAYLNEYWANYADSHLHEFYIDNEGNKVVLPEVDYVDTGFFVSGSDNYNKNDVFEDMYDLPKDTFDYFPIVQNPTNTDTCIVEDSNGNLIENTGDIFDIDRDFEDVSSSDVGEDTSSWGVLDFLRGLFNTIKNLFDILKNCLFSILKGISNIGKTIIGLFVPDSDFWGDFSSDINFELESHLGLLFQPFELLGGLFERYNNIEFSDPKLVIPELVLPVYNYKIFNGMELTFDVVYENAILNNLHNVYLICVDAYFGFLIFNRILEIEKEVFKK